MEQKAKVTGLNSSVKNVNDSIGIEVSIVMPCLNEAETLATCINKAIGWLSEKGVMGEIIVADNGSTDGSQQIALDMGARLIQVETRGYGNALMGGISAARGEFVIMGDADDSYDFSSLTPFIEKLRSGYDLVMGNRFRGGILPGAMPPLHRYLGNPVLTTLGRLFFDSPVGDFHCGLRAFRKAAVERMNLQTAGMEFASEMVVKATLYGMRITEVPTSLAPDGRSRPPHLRSWRDGWRHLRFLLLYSPRWLFLYPGFLLMLVGAIIILWLWPGPRTIWKITLDVHTLLYGAVAIIIGFQAVCFAVFTKVFAISQGLLPDDQRLTKIFRYITLEVGLIIGALLFLLGMIGSIYSIYLWGERSYGPLAPSAVLRIVVPSCAALALGFQIVLFSFFLSVLGLKRR